jgi:streptogramin lyase/mono/diheme cytochrome c family protein
MRREHFFIATMVCAATGALLTSQGRTADSASTQLPASSAGEYVEREIAGSPEGNFIVPLPSASGLTVAQLKGKKLFVQRCSVCHLPGLPTYNSYGGLLNRSLLVARGDEAVTKTINNGTRRMPGWKYALTEEEVDAIVAYLKTVEYSTTATDAAQPPAAKSVPASSVYGTGDLASGLFTGVTRLATGATLDGVAVTARMEGSPITTTVYSDAQGRFVFPALPRGQYEVWAQAVGYDAARANLTLDISHPIAQVLTLKVTADPTRQLSTAEWLASLPDATLADRRMKHIFDNTCNSCHQANFVLQNRFDAAGWRAIVERMAITDTYASEKGRRDRIIDHYADELVAYLARVRGPESSVVPKLLPRPHDEAARVVITEYNVAPAESPNTLVDQDGSDWSERVPSAGNGARGVHDIAIDFQGNAWVTDGEANRHRTFFKVDAKTGMVTNFRVAAPNGFARGSHGIDVDQHGIIWINLFPGPGTSGRGPGSLCRVDPATGQFELFDPAPGRGNVGMTVEVDGKGKVWAVSPSGATAFDPATKVFTPFKSTTPGVGGYGVAGDRQGNGWWVTPGKDVVGFGDYETGTIAELPIAPRGDMLELATAEDRAFFEQVGSNTGTAILPSQGPRRMSAGPDAVWWANFWGHSIGKADLKTHAVTLYPSPIIDAHTYDVALDRRGRVWVALMTDDRVARFDPASQRWTVFQLPSLGFEMRHIAVDNHRAALDVWVPSYRTSKVARLQFRTEAQLVNILKNAPPLR